MNLELLCLLVGKLRMGTTSVIKRVSKYEVFKYIHKAFRLGVGHDEIISECEKTTKSPMIVVISSADRKSQHFIKLDKYLMPISDKFSFNNVIELLFNAFTTFKIKYTPELYNFFVRIFVLHKKKRANKCI
jgi:hypothetical protein